MILRYILGCVVLYNKITMSVTPNNITINPPYKKTTYGLYQYRTISIHIWIISIQDYTHNERVKRVLYTIYQQMKRYNHFNTTITGQKHYLPISIAPHITLPQDERTTTNNIFIPERPQPIKCRTIYHHIKPLQYNRTLYYKIRESILYQRQRKELTTRAIYRTKDNNLFNAVLFAF